MIEIQQISHIGALSQKEKLIPILASETPNQPNWNGICNRQTISKLPSVQNTPGIRSKKSVDLIIQTIKIREDNRLNVAAKSSQKIAVRTTVRAAVSPCEQPEMRANDSIRSPIEKPYETRFTNTLSNPGHANTTQANNQIAKIPKSFRKPSTHFSTWKTLRYSDREES